MGLIKKKEKIVVSIKETEDGRYITLFKKWLKNPGEGLDILVAALCNTIKIVAMVTGQPVEVYKALAISEIERILKE